jgi:hypothetical protein
MRTRRTIAVASGLTASALHIAKLQLVPVRTSLPILYFTTTTFVFMMYQTSWQFASAFPMESSDAHPLTLVCLTAFSDGSPLDVAQSSSSQMQPSPCMITDPAGWSYSEASRSLV